MNIFNASSRPNVQTNVMNTMYWLSREGAYLLIKELLTGTFLTNFAKLFSEPSDNVISFMQFPFDICKATGTTPNIKNIDIGVVEMSSQASFSTTSVVVARISYKNINVPKKFNSFLDYAPYTDVSIYLPFFGFTELETNIVMGKNIDVDYIISLIDGSATITISTDDGIIKTLNCMVGTNIAIGGGSMNNVAKAIMGGITDMGLNILSSKVGSGFTVSPSGYTITNKKVSRTERVINKTYNAPTVTKNPPASPMESLNKYVDSLRTLCNTQYKISRGNTQGNFNQYFMPLRPTLFITRPKSFYPDDYNHLLGRPSGESKQLGELKGFTSVDAMHVEGFSNATQSERDNISNALTSGVLLGYEFVEGACYYLGELDEDAVSVPMEIYLPFTIGGVYYDTIVIDQYGDVYYRNRQDRDVPDIVVFSQGSYVTSQRILNINSRFVISNNTLNTTEYKWLIEHTERSSN